ncbi:UNVERIFIED_CONTAM: hypothetical protein GTU68_048930 [Idotea baltica]|nr:hypothetical protein [Idotea baltica]
MKKELLFATNNPHKLEEIRAIAPADCKIISLQEIGFTEDIPEPYETIAENALHKAKVLYEKFGMITIADDTGLEVEALNGAPGVYSARYAGDNAKSTDNISLLLNNLKSYSNRNAQFKTVIAYLSTDAEMLFEGIIKGKISESARGVGGFGYDPVFLPQNFDQSFAEMPPSLKNEISHRSLAMQRLLTYLNSLDQ